MTTNKKDLENVILDNLNSFESILAHQTSARKEALQWQATVGIKSRWTTS